MLPPVQEYIPDRVEIAPCTAGWAVTVKSDYVFLNHRVVDVSYDQPPEEQRQAIQGVLAAWGLQIPTGAPWTAELDGTYLLPLT